MRPSRSAHSIGSVIAVVVLACSLLAAPGQAPKNNPDKAGAKWVEKTLKNLTLDEKIGQLLVPSLESTYLSADSQQYESLMKLAIDYHVSGFHVFGGRELAPAVLLNPTYGTVTLGDPTSIAATLNRLQGAAMIPLLNTGDFETGIGMRIMGATLFPRAMAFGAARDEQLALEAGRITGIEGRAIGVHVDFAPVVDVNNNPRNPVINTRSFGEDPALVGRLASAFVRGLHEGGMLATLKHFPGHGDTDVDSHLGLPRIDQPRSRLETLELLPFRTGIEAGADAVMTAHIELPAIDATPGVPATFSRQTVTNLLRDGLRFQGLAYTDSMSMDAVTRSMGPGEAAARAVAAGNDIVLHSPDPIAAFESIKTAIARGDISEAQIDRSVERILSAKARLGLQAGRLVDLGGVSSKVGGRTHDLIAQTVSQRAITLIKDAGGLVPLNVPRDAQVLYLSVLDYPTGWRIAAPSRTFIPELKSRWPNVTAIELSDRSTSSELELIRASLDRYDAVIAGVFVRTYSGSGRMDLAEPIVRLLQDLGRQSAGKRPFIACLFGNPYVAMVLGDVPAIIETFDLHDHAEAAAVRALSGDAPISGRLPISLPGMFSVGHGLNRPARTSSQ